VGRAAIDEADDLTLSAGVSRSTAGQSLATAAGSSSHGLVYATVAEALESAQVDVLIAYTTAAAVKTNAQTAVVRACTLVIGSSGLTSGDYQELDRLAWARGVGVIAAGNFSIMAAVLRHAAPMAAQHLNHWEIIDHASDDKPEVPSGTSRGLADGSPYCRRADSPVRRSTHDHAARPPCRAERILFASRG
jgi:4-hydroxy-tetrahydrodipicolinate reductase